MGRPKKINTVENIIHEQVIDTVSETKQETVTAKKEPVKKRVSKKDINTISETKLISESEEKSANDITSSNSIKKITFADRLETILDVASESAKAKDIGIATAKHIVENYELPTWDILDAFFKQGGDTDCSNNIVRHQIESFNEFIDKQLIQIIQGFNSIQVCHNYNATIGNFKYKIHLNILKPSLTKPVYQTTDGTQILMTPHLARMNNLTYASNLYVSIHVITDIINDDGVTERKENTIQNVCIGKIPIMVRSKACVLSQMPGIAEGDGNHECRYDYGGYFIINGNEKVIISQDRISENKTLVFAPNGNGDGLYAEIRSMPDGMFLPPKTTSLHLSGKSNHMGNIIRLSASFLRSEVPLFVMFRALGIESDKEIYAHIVLDLDAPKQQRMLTQLAACSEDAYDYHTQEDALTCLLKILGTTGTPKEFLDQPKRAFEILKNTIKNDFLSHVGHSFKKKALYLGYMVRKLLSIHLRYLEFDNRDSYLHKRIDTPGILFSNLFRQCYGKLIKEVRNLVVRELNLWRASTNMPVQLINQNNVHRFFKQTLIETGLRYALSTGNWGVKSIGSFQNIRQGVAQVLNRMSYLSTLSHMRRINTPMEKNGKLVQPRKLENSQYGMICPSETPEGAAVGLVKNIALSTHITVNVSSAFVRETLMELGTEHYGDHITDTIGFLHRMGADDSVHIMMNGDIIGFHTNPEYLYTQLKHLKRYGSIPPTTSIVWDVQKSLISLSTEAGRMLRPLYIIDTPDKLNKFPQIRLFEMLKKYNISWKDFHEKYTNFQSFVAPMIDDTTEGFIEYMDVDEIDKGMVAMFPNHLKRTIKGTTLPPKFTHCEIEPSLLNGVLAANIPFMDHNQAPRNCYQCLWIEEPVLLTTGEMKAIKDIAVGDMVYCFNLKTNVLEPTRVINQYCRMAQKPIKHITVISGRRIVATNDHKFHTTEGWKAQTDFHANTRLLIHPAPCTMNSIPKNNNEIAMNNSQLYNSVYDQLYLYGLGNITSSHSKLPIIARLAGYMYSCKPLKFTSKVDEIRFNTDIASLGFTDGYLDRTFIVFMTALGASDSIPPWVWDGSKLVQREYVNGYLGGYVNSGLGNSTTFDGNPIIPLMNSIVTDPSITPNDIEKFMSVFSYAYSHIYNMIQNKEAEYEKYLKYVKNTQKGEPMSKITWDSLIEIHGDMLVMPIGNITDMRTCMVADITVESGHHCFIGGHGFAVSNSAMGKQAVGIYMSNFNHRIDTMAHVLHYPQKPLVRTKLSKYTNSIALPSGINAIVAIMTHTGFNQEDSVMLNKSAIDRGLFTSTYFKSYRDQCSKNHSTGEEEIFTKPIVEVSASGKMKPFNYEKLGEDGFIPKNTYVDSHDILVGKIMPQKVQGVITERDTSLQVKGNDDGHVDLNYQGINGDGYKFCKIRMRKYRKPQIGDKLACASMDHTILVKGGEFKNFHDLTDTDEVAVLVDGKLRYEIPEAKHYYPEFKGKMYHISNQGVDLDVTYNHRMWVSSRGNQKQINGKYKDIWLPYTFEFAEDIIGKRKRYKKDAEWDAPDYQFILPELKTERHFYESKKVEMTSWLTFIGIWIAEGWTSSSTRQNRTCMNNTVTIAANKPRVQEALSRVLPELGYKYTINDKSKKVSISNAQLYDYMSVLSVGATKKTLPSWVWILSKLQTQILIEALLLGDGHKTNTSIHYYTSSSVLAEELQVLALHAGWAADINIRYYAGHETQMNDGSIIKSTADSWVVNIRIERVNPTVNHGHVKEQHIQKEYMYDFEGPVFCLTVSSGVFMVKKNGKATWTGNSRSAQKGTIGMVYNHQDMPFTKDGISPDIIMNPHAIPSRMTIGQLMECIMGKACCHIGAAGDSTPFTDCSVESIANVLSKSGFEKYGNEILYNGRTGEQMKTEIFIGPTYYQRLKHMVSDKSHSRGSNGPIVLLTRQPAEGRARNGGLRFGEMERDAIVAHGASAFLKERMLDVSDNFRVFICRQCGLICTANPEKNIYKCSTCKNNADITQVRIPYAMKLLIQELMTMGVAPRITV